MTILRQLVPALRQRWLGCAIELRAASGFALPALYDCCETEGLTHIIGLIPNPRLEALAAPLLAEAAQQQAETGAEKVCLAGESDYLAGSWPQERRVVVKAEVLSKGPNTRFVVTNRSDEPLALYNWYVQRGTSEQWIQDFKVACNVDLAVSQSTTI